MSQLIVNHHVRTNKGRYRAARAAKKEGVSDYKSNREKQDPSAKQVETSGTRNLVATYKVSSNNQRFQKRESGRKFIRSRRRIRLSGKQKRKGETLRSW